MKTTSCISLCKVVKWIFSGLFVAMKKQWRHCLCLTGNSNYCAGYCCTSLKSSVHWDAEIRKWHRYCAGEITHGRFYFTDLVLLSLTPLWTSSKTDAAPATQQWNELLPSEGAHKTLQPKSISHSSPYFILFKFNNSLLRAMIIVFNWKTVKSFKKRSHV